MEYKYFEVRDRSTCMIVLAIKTTRNIEQEDKFLNRLGYGKDSIILLDLSNSMKANHDPYKWSDSRTLKNAHLYIEDNFDYLYNFSVIDIEYILGETSSSKTSDIIK